MRTSLTPHPLTPETFAPYGQVLSPEPDGKPFDRTDAQLDLSQGTPRFYLMQLQERGLQFSRITRHQHCTQCLGAIGGQTWYLAVAPPSADPQPDPESIRAFCIAGPCFIKLHKGTWHAGPYFEPANLTFYNLELSDTNLVDHTTHDFGQATPGLEFVIELSASF
ncbi:MAG: ureidoglycolate lyase [Cyanobacteria bacterium P01_G01_bin.54]